MASRPDSQSGEGALAGLGALAPFIGTSFPLGQLLVTTNALRRITMEDVTAGLGRHARRDWGDLTKNDRQANDEALTDGGRLLSAYHAANGEKFWIITEADRSATTVLLPEDY